MAVEPIDIEKFLSQADPALGRLIAVMVPLVGTLRIPASQLSPFEALIRAVVYQQLAGKAAEAIHKRLKQAVKGRLTPTKLRALTPEQLRAAGLSKQKARYVHNVAEWFAANRKLAKQLPDLPNEAVIAALTDISGIGLWTANVFLMFTLSRPDVVPATDLGIQNGVRLIYRMKTKPSPALVEKKARQWRPYRTIACLYLWQAVTRKITPADLK